MNSGSLTDLDPPPARERRWPFYVAWTMGGFVVGAVLFSHLPASLAPAAAPVAGSKATEPTIPTSAPAAPRLVPPQATPLRLIGPVGPVLVVPARP
jgi:hypothetical protein